MSKFGALALEVEQPSRMIIVHPVNRQPLRDTEGKEAFIDVYSGDSEVARKHQRAMAKRRLAVRGNRGRQSIEELEAESTALLAALTAGWYLLGLNGEPLGVLFTPDNARELYADPAVSWLREQVDEYAGDRANFSPASSSSLSPGQSTSSDELAGETTGQRKGSTPRLQAES